MPTIRQIGRRIRSVQGTAKLANAMAMVAASKVRRAQQRGMEGRPYAEQLRGVMTNLMAAAGGSGAPHPLLQQRAVLRVGYIHITADRGLCGALNANMNRAGFQFVVGQPVEVGVVAVGRRGRDFMARSGQDLRAIFDGLGDNPALVDTLPIARIVIDDYLNGRFDQVYLGYSDFVSTLVQRPRIERLIPVAAAPLDPGYRGEYLYEPSPAAVLNALLPRYVEMQVYHAILEHIASEQSARMVAMRGASDNARDMIKDLTLTYNKTRHELITRELLDRVGGAAARPHVEGLAAGAYERLMHERREGGMIHVRLTTAVPLPPDGQEAVRAILDRQLGRRVYLTVEVDRSILAGAILRFGDRLVDGSARGRIETLRRDLAGD